MEANMTRGSFAVGTLVYLVSGDAGSSAVDVPKVIRVSPGISVTDVRYLYEEAVQAGSDHAVVVADIELA
jgi:hypothetical protein